MEDHGEEELNPFGFFDDQKAKDYFSKIDYFLKSGTHLQREYPRPAALYYFLEKHFDSLKQYYGEYFSLVLSKGGQPPATYYYLDFDSAERSSVPSELKDYLKTEHLIIGLLFLKVYKFDGNIEIESLSEFIKVLFNDYEDEKNSLLSIFLDSDSSFTTDRNDDIVVNKIRGAFKKFGDLGWIRWEDDDRFSYLPSFARLSDLYESQILNIDELFKDVNTDE